MAKRRRPVSHTRAQPIDQQVPQKQEPIISPRDIVFNPTANKREKQAIDRIARRATRNTTLAEREAAAQEAIELAERMAEQEERSTLSQAGVKDLSIGDEAPRPRRQRVPSVPGQQPQGRRRRPQPTARPQRNEIVGAVLGGNDTGRDIEPEDVSVKSERELQAIDQGEYEEVGLPVPDMQDEEEEWESEEDDDEQDDEEDDYTDEEIEHLSDRDRERVRRGELVVSKPDSEGDFISGPAWSGDVPTTPGGGMVHHPADIITGAHASFMFGDRLKVRNPLTGSSVVMTLVSLDWDPEDGQLHVVYAPPSE